MSQFDDLIGKKLDGSGDATIKTIISDLKVLWYAWECDSDAAIVELSNGEKCLIVTDHGGAILLNKEKAIKFLAGKAEEYLDLIKDYSKSIGKLL
jgi:hypothetical protein